MASLLPSKTGRAGCRHRGGDTPFRPAFALAGMLVAALSLASCHPGGTGAPGDSNDTHPYAGIGADEPLHFTGTEPFWSAELTGGTIEYRTAENRDAVAIAVTRFAGRNGVSFSGTLDGKGFTAAVSPGQCGDGMSDRVYPFNVTLVTAGETRNGCAWSEIHPYSGPRAP